MPQIRADPGHRVWALCPRGFFYSNRKGNDFFQTSRYTSNITGSAKYPLVIPPLRGHKLNRRTCTRLVDTASSTSQTIDVSTKSRVDHVLTLFVSTSCYIRLQDALARPGTALFLSPKTQRFLALFIEIYKILSRSKRKANWAYHPSLLKHLPCRSL